MFVDKTRQKHGGKIVTRIRTPSVNFTHLKQKCELPYSMTRS